MGDLMASRYRGRERERMKKEKQMKRLGDMEEEKLKQEYNIPCPHDCISALLLININ